FPVSLLVPFHFFFTATPSPTIYPLSLHDALPISYVPGFPPAAASARRRLALVETFGRHYLRHASGRDHSRAGKGVHLYQLGNDRDRKSTRLNSSHLGISYAVFCLKKKKK